jgi:ABC-type Fe3+ transport system permease subunit
MSFHEAFFWSVLRAVAAAGLAVPMSVCLARFVQQATGRSRLWRMILVFAPLVAPDLVVGYAYRSFDLSLLHRPVLNHCFYFVLALLKFLPAAAVVRLCSPPAPVSASALHCAHLASRRPGAATHALAMQLQSSALKHLPVFGIVFLLMLQEFEIASLLQIPAWTVHLFDAQASGLNPTDSARWLMLPVLIQAVILLPVIWCVLRNARQAIPRWRLNDRSSSRASWMGCFLSVTATALLWVIPLAIVSVSGGSGIVGVLRNEILIRSTLLDLTAAMAISAPCAILALLAADRLRVMASAASTLRNVSEINSRNQPAGASPRLVRRELGASVRRLIGLKQNWEVVLDTVLSSPQIRRAPQMMRSGVLILAVLPGLFGTLAICAVVLLAIQQPPLTELRSTVWPMAFALILFLIPRALLLTLLVLQSRDAESGHLAELLNSSTDSKQRRTSAMLKWWYELRPGFLIAAVLFFWSMANLTAAALLCPPTIPLLSFDGNIVPLPVRLYKFIHQGRTASLSVMALLSVVVPLLFILLLSRVTPRLFMRISRVADRRH